MLLFPRELGTHMHSRLPAHGPVAASGRQSHYREDIDGLRAIAVLAVVTHHFGRDLLPSGFLGVDIFFVISGYVISASLTSHSTPTIGPFLLGFYARRVKRLMPALIACVLVTGILILAIDPAPLVSLRTGATALFGVSNVSLALEQVDYFSRSIEFNVFAQTWSLGVEEQFYLVFPILLWIGLRRPRHYLGLLSFLALLSLVVFVVGTVAAPRQTYFWMPVRFWELAAGALLFAITKDRPLSGLHPLVPPALLLAALAILFVPLDFQAPATVAIVAATAGLIATTQPGTKVHFLLSNPFVRYLGLISYSLYLWHWSVLSIARWTVGISATTLPFLLAASLALAILSYEFVERPFRRGTGHGWRTVVVGFVVAAGSIVTLYGGLGLRDSWGIRPLVSAISMPTGSQPRIGKAFGPSCQVFSQRPLTATAIDDCTLPPSTPGAPTIWVVGDSHAGHLQGMLYSLHDRYGFGAHVIETPGAYFPILNGNGTEPGQIIFDRILERMRPGDILVAARLLLEKKGGNPPHYANLPAWGDALVDLAATLHDRGVGMVVMGPLPIFTFDAIVHCVLLADTCDVRRASIVARASEALTVLDGASAREPNLHVFDAFSQLCPVRQESCSPVRGGVATFRDADHLTGYGAETLAEPFVEFLEENSLI